MLPFYPGLRGPFSQGRRSRDPFTLEGVLLGTAYPGLLLGFPYGEATVEGFGTDSKAGQASEVIINPMHFTILRRS